MGAVTAVSRVIGFARVLVVAAVLGTTYLGNAFQAANSLSNVLFELLAAGALSAVLVPTFVSLLDAGDQDGAEQVAGGVLWVALCGLGAITVAGIAAAPVLARLLTLGVPAEVAGEQRELVTYLLRFFLPQVLLYAAGTVATAALYAKRRFAVTAAAPIGNTVVMVAALLAFRAAAGADPGLELDTTERLLLVVAGTGGVVAFVGILLVACRRAGFRLRPRHPRGDPRVGAALVHSAWGAVLHTGAGALLGAAVVAGSAVEGAVVAYQVGWVFFLAPYGILAQPIHTAILPELVAEAGDPARFAASVRWAVERIAALVLPVSALLVALAAPGMRLVAFGEATDAGAELLGAALASLAVGLLPYSAFLLLARVSYALGDSRTPGAISLASAAVGIAVMGSGALLDADGTERVALLGAGHTVAYVVGTAVLSRRLERRLGAALWPPSTFRFAGAALVAGVVAWGVQGAVEVGSGRVADLAAAAAGGVAGLAVVAVAVRLLRLPVPGRPGRPPVDTAPAVGSGPA
jgi:putative peptidoglycan lipid II flippase